MGGSSVDFDTNGFGFDGSLELDLYGGWAGAITDNVGVDVGYMYYGYPGDEGDGYDGPRIELPERHDDLLEDLRMERDGRPNDDGSPRLKDLVPGPRRR